MIINRVSNRKTEALGEGGECYLPPGVNADIRVTPKRRKGRDRERKRMTSSSVRDRVTRRRKGLDSGGGGDKIGFRKGTFRGITSVPQRHTHRGYMIHSRRVTNDNSCILNGDGG